ncbi:MAG: XRE family transcriptional regulator [Gemmatimonadetes bacterium]|nr:XRE family transcriptional regulator [Gemmatimonadota bacterium]
MKRSRGTRDPASRRVRTGPTRRSSVVREREFEGTTHVTPADGNVFQDLGFPPAEAQSLLMRSQLMTAVMNVIKRRRLTQIKAAKVFGVTQPRISDLMRGKIDRFTLDALVNMLAHAGIKVTLHVGRTAA